MTYVSNTGMRSARYPFQGVGGLGCGCSMPVAIAGLGGTSDPVPKGESVTLAFRGVGVNPSNQTPVLDAIRTAVLGTGHFEAPLYLGWGEGGTLVYRGKTKSSNYSLQEIARFMEGIARRVSQMTGRPVTFASAKDTLGNEVTAGDDGLPVWLIAAAVAGGAWWFWSRRQAPPQTQTTP